MVSPSNQDKTEKKKVETKPSNSKSTGKEIGYCIRTGVEIPFNIKKPFSPDAFKRWNEFGDPTNPENFCHFSGEPSNGETSKNKPIMLKNWKKASEIHGL